MQEPGTVEYIRAWVYICIWIAIQVWSSLYDTQSHVAYTAHLGGVAFGLLSGAVLRLKTLRGVQVA